MPRSQSGRHDQARGLVDREMGGDQSLLPGSARAAPPPVSSSLEDSLPPFLIFFFFEPSDMSTTPLRTKRKRTSSLARRAGLRGKNIRRYTRADRRLPPRQAHHLPRDFRARIMTHSMREVSGRRVMQANYSGGAIYILELLDRTPIRAARGGGHPPGGHGFSPTYGTWFEWGFGRRLFSRF